MRWRKCLDRLGSVEFQAYRTALTIRGVELIAHRNELVLALAQLLTLGIRKHLRTKILIVWLFKHQNGNAYTRTFMY